MMSAIATPSTVSSETQTTVNHMLLMKAFVRRGMTPQTPATVSAVAELKALK